MVNKFSFAGTFLQDVRC